MKITLGRVPSFGKPSNFVRVWVTWRGAMVWANWRGTRFYRMVAWRPYQEG